MKFYGIDSINPIQLGTPSNDNGLTNLLVWDPASKTIKYRDSSSISGGGSSSQNLSQVLSTGNDAGTYSINFVDDNSKIFGIVAGTSFYGWTATMSSILAFTSSAFAFRPDTTQQLSGLSVLNSIIGGVEYFYPGSGRSQHAWLMSKGSNDNITSKTELCVNNLCQYVCDSLNNCLSYLTLQSSTVNLYSCQGGSCYSLQYMTPTYICKMTSLGTTTSILSLGTPNQSIRIFTNDVTFTNEIVINPDMVQLNGVAGADGQVFSVNSTGQLCWQTVSGGTGGGSVVLPSGEVGFGSGTGITSSDIFTFNTNKFKVATNTTISSDSYKSSVIGGENHVIDYQSYASIISGGYNNTICQGASVGIFGGNQGIICNLSHRSSIIGGYCNQIATASVSSFIGGGESNIIHTDSCLSMILGGISNTVSLSTLRSSVIGGCINNISNSSNNSVILGGTNNIINYSSSGNIMGGSYNIVCANSNASSVLGGNCNIVNDSEKSSIISGDSNLICYQSYQSVIIAGQSNTIYAQSNKSSILGGSMNCLQNHVENSSIVGGLCNEIQNYSSNSTIIGGCNNAFYVASKYSSIVGGIYNRMTCSGLSAIIGGAYNNMYASFNSVTLGGTGSCIYGSYKSFIGGGETNQICFSYRSSIIGGITNRVVGINNYCVYNSAIIGGSYNKVGCRDGGVLPTNSVVIGGFCNYIYDTSSRSVIVGGQCNQIRCSNDSVIIGGNCIVILQCDCAVITPSLVTSYPSGGSNPTPPDLGEKFKIGTCVVSGSPHSVSTYCWISANIGGSYVRIAILQ